MIARLFGWTMIEVRAHTGRDIAAYAQLIVQERRRERMRRAAAKAPKGRRR